MSFERGDKTNHINFWNPDCFEVSKKKQTFTHANRAQINSSRQNFVRENSSSRISVVYLSSIKYVLDIGDRTFININVLKKK